MPDNINHPPHYNRGSVETIDMIKNSMAAPEFEGYLQGNVIKYISRYKYKGTALEDLQKAEWYINRLIREVEDLIDTKPSDTE
jgi:hypothetical protein|tara:strand:+ start:759 stop:1007 length:249 start_codon:yes stop_codon:yes gene_type:complete